MAKEMPDGFDWKSITPDDSPLTPKDLFADRETQDLANAKCTTGDPAPDFALGVFDFSDGTKKATDQTFHLSEVAANRPVALIFGSYT